MKSIILFASGRGSNVQAIIEYFRDKNFLKVAMIVANNPNAGVIDLAKEYNIPLLQIDRQSIKEKEWIENIIAAKPDLIVLAGYLWKIPSELVQAFENKIINIHPALLPGYGGKGMYGMNVHNAVLNAKERESGITIHYVNEHYDEGNIILQARCKIEPGDTPEMLAEKIHHLEHFYFPRAIEFLLK